jgi:RecB family endonuclease NucS
MLTEQMMEDAIIASPGKYVEEGLVLLSRQFRIGSYIFDLLFEDRHGAKLIVELQKGTLDRNHT